ncbi:MAG TPA: XdhC family protein [Ferruginibacter sp.]|nr:XdhC family protein [Ferruginibacter sp.]HMP21228.1 XdhC family protein [Ferruginibacter sp.]
MQKKIHTWQFILKNIQLGTGVVMLYVLESSGSSPGRQGFLMAVNTNGEMHGSIGGGIMEHKFVEMAKSRLNDGLQEHSLHHQFHDKTAASNQSGMICSGEQTIFIYTVLPKDKTAIEKVIQALVHLEPGCIILTATGIGFENSIPPNEFEFTKTGDAEFIYREKTGSPNYLHIIGGGHCSLAFSALMHSMDFYIHVYDERAGLNTMEANTHAHEKQILHSYADLKNIIPYGQGQYAVIMTFGYRTDKIALQALLNKHFFYLGVLGSKTKISKMFNDMQLEGIAAADLTHIHAPVGIPIKSRTPEEIAISIAAEIIQVKNRNLP